MRWTTNRTANIWIISIFFMQWPMNLYQRTIKVHLRPGEWGDRPRALTFRDSPDFLQIWFFFALRATKQCGPRALRNINAPLVSMKDKMRHFYATHRIAAQRKLRINSINHIAKCFMIIIIILCWIYVIQLAIIWLESHLISDRNANII